MHRQLAQIILRKRDLLDAINPAGRRVQQFVNGKDKRAGEKEMDERFAQPPANMGWLRVVRSLRPGFYL
jgi:hypothetical protein